MAMNIEHPNQRPICRQMRTGPWSGQGCACFFCVHDRIDMGTLADMVRRERLDSSLSWRRLMGLLNGRDALISNQRSLRGLSAIRTA